MVLSERDQKVVASMRGLQGKSDAELLQFGAHCARIGVQPGSIVADAIAVEMIRRGLVSGYAKDGSRL